MTYKELLYAVTIYDEGSFSAAAKKLYISQSALSQAIRKLESEFGFDLFIRSGSNSVPTKGCHLFVEQGRSVLQAWAQFESEMHIYAEGQQSELTVGLPALLLKNILPFILPQFEKEHPEVKLNIIEERSDALEKLAIQDAINLCVLWTPVSSAALEYTHVFSSEILLAVPREHPFCRKHPYKGLDHLEEVDLRELQNEPFSLLKHQRSDHIWPPIFKDAGFEPTIYRRSIVWSNIVDFIKHGTSVGFIDEVVAQYEPNEEWICYYRLNTGPILRDVVVGHAPGKRLSRQEQWFVDALKQYPSLLHQREKRP